MTIQERLFRLQDKKYAEFQSKLTPGIDPEKFIGVRVPAARKLAKEFFNEAEHLQFMKCLPHDFYDENLLHSLLICENKDYEDCLCQVEEFLPYIDNWAVCDALTPKVFKKHKDRLITEIPRWAASKETYTCRFGIGMLMIHFLDEDFKPEYLKIPASVKSDEYYVNMMIAWFFATALAKQWDESIKYIEENKLDVWAHNKSIQKAIESYRITDEQKAYLRTLKRK